MAAYGSTTDAGSTATETLTIPPASSGFGGLHVEMSSTAMVGLGEGARYLVSIRMAAPSSADPARWRCCWPRTSEMRSRCGHGYRQDAPAVQQTLKDLERYQCPAAASPTGPVVPFDLAYLTAYLLTSSRSRRPEVRRRSGHADRAYTYLEEQLATPPPAHDGWWPAYTAWQAFAVKVLVEGAATRIRTSTGSTDIASGCRSSPWPTARQLRLREKWRGRASRTCSGA